MAVTLCTGEGCPLREGCGLYCPTLDKRKTFHWSPIPYGRMIVDKTKCYYFIEKEIDPPYEQKLLNYN